MDNNLINDNDSLVNQAEAEFKLILDNTRDEYKEEIERIYRPLIKAIIKLNAEILKVNG